MSKQLNFNYNGTAYTLEYTRRTVEQMEREGFVADDLKTKPLTMLPTLFAGAFKANHRYVKREVIDEIYSKMTNKADLIGKLAEMYNEPIMALIDEPEESAENLTWTQSW
jgi:DNA-binding IclR family transcriptional regulator